MLCPKDLTNTLQTCFKFGGIFFYCLQIVISIFIYNVYRKFDISKAEAERLSVHLPPAAVRGIFSLKMDLKRIRTNVCFPYRQEQEDVV